MNKYPKISILCFTYNHEKYIQQALDSFLLQKTDFDFEILVNDDASTDRTVEILKQYRKKHPDVIRLVLQEENQFSRGFSSMMIRNLFLLSKGEYVAFCDGDDFFIDEKKLQLQSIFLDEHPESTICFHPVRVFFEDGDGDDQIWPNLSRVDEMSVERLLRANFISSNSVMYRKKKDYGTHFLAKDILPADWYLHLYHAKAGKIGYIDKVMSAYRRHENGIYWLHYKDSRKALRDNIRPMLNFCVEILNLYGDDPKYNDAMAECVESFLGKGLKTENSRLETENSNLRQAIKEMEASKFWKLRKKLRKIYV